MADICRFCRKLIDNEEGVSEMIDTPDGEELAHSSCVSDAEEYEDYLRDNEDYLRARAAGWED